MIDNKLILDVLYYLQTWFPCIVCGFIFAHYSLFNNFFDDIFKNNIKKYFQFIVWIFLICISFFGRYFSPTFSIGNITFLGVGLGLTFNMDIIYAPLFIYATVNLVVAMPFKRVLTVISEVGKYSLIMWFLHCIFFNVCKSFFQPILYFPRNPIIVLFWGLLICYIVAVVINIPVKKLIGLKNKAFSSFLLKRHKEE